MPSANPGYPERLPNARPKKLLYPHPTDGQVVVERLLPQEVRPLVVGRIVDLLYEAYWHEFEAPDLESDLSVVPFDQGTVGRHFNPYNDDALIARGARMTRDMNEKGSTYWLVGGREPATGAFPLQALAKVSQSLATPLQKVGLVSPNCYIDQVADLPNDGADTQRPRHRYGSMVLHAALVGSGFGARRQVVADVHQGGRGSGQAFFDAAGMTPRPEPCEPFVLNQYTNSETVIPNERYGGQTVEGAIAALEARAPWLAQVTSEY